MVTWVSTNLRARGHFVVYIGSQQVSTPLFGERYKMATLWKFCVSASTWKRNDPLWGVLQYKCFCENIDCQLKCRAHTFTCLVKLKYDRILGLTELKAAAELSVNRPELQQAFYVSIAFFGLCGRWDTWSILLTRLKTLWPGRCRMSTWPVQCDCWIRLFNVPGAAPITRALVGAMPAHI